MKSRKSLRYLRLLGDRSNLQSYKKNWSKANWVFGFNPLYSELSISLLIHFFKKMFFSVPSIATVHGPKKHLTWVAAPKHWMLKKLTKVFVYHPSNWENVCLSPFSKGRDVIPPDRR
jgi:hypothetical protein